MRASLGCCQIGVRVERVSRYLLADAQPVRLSDFMIPVSIGSVAGFIAGVLARKAMDGEHDATKDTAAAVVNAGVFMLVGGLMFVLRQRRVH